MCCIAEPEGHNKTKKNVRRVTEVGREEERRQRREGREEGRQRKRGGRKGERREGKRERKIKGKSRIKELKKETLITYLTLVATTLYVWLLIFNLKEGRVESTS